MPPKRNAQKLGSGVLPSCQTFIYSSVVLTGSTALPLRGPGEPALRPLRPGRDRTQAVALRLDQVSKVKAAGLGGLLQGTPLETGHPVLQRRQLPLCQENQGEGGRVPTPAPSVQTLPTRSGQAEQTRRGWAARLPDRLSSGRIKALAVCVPPRPVLLASCSCHQSLLDPLPGRVGAAELFALRSPREGHAKMPMGQVPSPSTAGKPQDALRKMGVTVTEETE